MNREKVKELRDFFDDLSKTKLESVKRSGHSVGFNMDRFISRGYCGTTACMAGHQLLLEGMHIDNVEFLDRIVKIDGGEVRFGNGVFSQAAKNLDITHAEAVALFLSFRLQEFKDAAELAKSNLGERYALEHSPFLLIKASDVVEVLDGFLDTGEVDWKPYLKRYEAHVYELYEMKLTEMEVEKVTLANEAREDEMMVIDPPPPVKAVRAPSGPRRLL